jgi:hypothetical protein
VSALGPARVAWRLARWGFWRGGWLPHYLARRRAPVPADGPIDVIVALVDHFEPPRRHGPERAVEIVEGWAARYRELVREIRDTDGRPPRHTWCYRSEYRNDGCLALLAELSHDGFGEVEFHLHHGHDTPVSFRRKLEEGLDWFNGRGAMLTAEAAPRRRFAYVAGNWSLDNGARRPETSGCDTELTELREAGCYADFTFPALGSPAQPRRVNQLFLAKDDPGPKSYDRGGAELSVGRHTDGDLLLFQGPVHVDWRRGTVEEAALENGRRPAAGRLDDWLRAHVHVRGRPEWIFVKLHTHSVQSQEVLLGAPMLATWRAMVERWTRPPFRLHFATAREAYNIALAAVDGREGDPDAFRDHVVAPPANRVACCSRRWRLLTATDERLALEVEPAAEPAILRIRWHVEGRLAGDLRALDLARLPDGSVRVAVEAHGPVTGCLDGHDLRGEGAFQAHLGRP